MKRVFRVASIVLACTSGADTQARQEVRVEHQVYAYQQGGLVSPGSEPVMAGAVGADGRMRMLNVTGKPFSASETRRTVQMLANGAKIENSDGNALYRDDQGRTRVEQTIGGRTTVVIMDPVAWFVAVLDRGGKTVHKTGMPPDAVNGGVALSDGKVMVWLGKTSESRTVEPGRILIVGSPGSAGLRVEVKDLGQKIVNGMMAAGTRETRTLPAGAIGNDRELQIVDERWFSPDLQLVVKSVNSDPRFGETSYDLTNIVRTTQDPALFQIPADYTVSENR